MVHPAASRIGKVQVLQLAQSQKVSRPVSCGALFLDASDLPCYVGVPPNTHEVKLSTALSLTYTKAAPVLKGFLPDPWGVKT